MARNLEADQQNLRTILGHAQKREFAAAAVLAERMLAEGFEHPLLLNVLATRLELAGRYAESLPLLARAVAIAPKDLGARNALALCLQRLDRHSEALIHLDELVKLHPGFTYGHANRGNTLIALGLLAQAEQSHRRALELDPANLAAITAIASIATHRGDHADARRWAQKALAIVPGLPDAVLSLAAAELAAGATEAAQQLLQQLILDSRGSPLDKARATGLLGDVYDAEARFEEAFVAYTTCNEALRQVHSEFGRGSDMWTYTRGLIDALERTGLAQWPQSTMDSPQAGGVLGHVFVVGFPRSGTTLLEVVLDQHPQVVSLEEHELLTDGVLRFMRAPLDLGPLMAANERDLQPLRTAYWHAVRRAGVDFAGKIFVDKHPLNTLKLPLIARLFPQARILFARRDPRDVVLSCFRRRFKMNPAMYELLSLQGAARFYAVVMEFAERTRPLFGHGWRSVRYEDLVDDFERETQAICDFLGIAAVGGLADFGDRVQARAHATPSTAQLARGLNRSGLDTWRNYEAQLAPIMPVLDEWVARFGYTA